MYNSSNQLTLSSGAVNWSAITGQPTGIYNSNISINSNGTLSGAGSGQVSLSGLGAGAFATLSRITAANISTYIQSAAIGEAYIGNAAITAAKIADASITSAKIANAAVGTLKVAGNAITASSTANLSIPSGTGTTRYSNIASFTAPQDTAITVLIVMTGRTGTTAGSLANTRHPILQMTSQNNTSTGVQVLVDMGASLWYGDYISASTLVTINAGVTRYFHVRLENPNGNVCTLSANLNFFAAKR